MNNKALLISLGICIGIILTRGAMWAIESFWDAGTESYVIESFSSPDLMHNVRIIAEGTPVWPFGPQTVHVEFDEIAQSPSITINTDGAEFSDYKVEWDNNEALVTLNTSSDEQVIYEASFNDEGVSLRIR